MKKRTAGIFVLFLLLYGLLLQSRFYGDGVLYLGLARAGKVYAHHHLYLPLLVPFERLLGFLGIGDRFAGFFFSAFCVSLGLAVLWGGLRSPAERSERTASQAEALLLLGLVATAPALVFFGTTAEVHALHFAFVCLCLRALEHAQQRGTSSAWLLAGLALMAVPASHLTGFLLLPYLCLYAASDGGKRCWPSPLLQRPSRLLFLLLPFLLYAWLMHLSLLFRQDVLQLSPELLSDPIAFQMKVSSAYDASLAQRMSYLLENGFYAAFGLVLVFFLGWGVLFWRSFAKACLLGMLLLPCVYFFSGQPISERGAYFLGLYPIFAFAIRDSRILMHKAMRWLVLVLLIAQAGYAGIALREYPAHAREKPWIFVEDARTLLSQQQGAHVTLICESLWRAEEARFELEGRVDAFHFPRIVQQLATGLDVYLAVFLQRDLPAQLAKGPVYLTGRLKAALPQLWPDLLPALGKRYRLVPKKIRGTLFLRVEARD